MNITLAIGTLSKALNEKWQVNLKIDYASTYKKDMRLVIKQGWDLEAVHIVVEQLQTCEILDERLNDHPIKRRI